MRKLFKCPMNCGGTMFYREIGNDKVIGDSLIMNDKKYGDMSPGMPICDNCAKVAKKTINEMRDFNRRHYGTN